MSKASTPSKPSSSVSSPPPPNGASPNEAAAVSSPVAISGGNARKGSLMVGGNGDIPQGNLAFGTVNSPNTLLSSSPAAPSTTGGHLADTVKSFGSIDAETNAAGASMIRPPRRTSGGNAAGSPSGLPQKQLDVHSLFAGKHPHAYQGQTGMPGQPHLRPPQAPPGQRSPVMGVAQPPFAGQAPQQGGYRGPQPQMQGGNQQSVRPGGVNGPMMPRPMMNQQQGMPYGMPHSGAPGYQMIYPGGYYYSPYSENYGMNQGWVPQQQPPPNMPMSPRSAQAQLGQPSPGPPSATLPGSGGGSPMPTPPSRPQSLVGGHASAPSQSSPMPTTPSRPLQPGTPFTPMTPGSQGPGTPASLSAGAAAFTPRAKSSAIKISRPDGTALNLTEAAAAAKGPATPEPVTEEPPKKKMPTLPVIVRLESEEQKKARLAEDEKRKKIKDQEEKEEAERKERLERRAKEEAERKAKEEEEEARQAKAAEERKAVEDSERKAKDEAEKAEKERANQAPEEAKEQASSTTDEQSPKPTESSTPTTEKDKADELRQSLLTPTTQSAAASPLASPALAAAGLPAKPVSAINGGSRRPTPSTLDMKNVPSAASNTSNSASASVPPSALSLAKPIEDLGSIEYPTSVKPLSAAFNKDSEPGKFRYDRDFLMQFMEVCKGKPDSLPNLEEIGLEADPNSGFGRRGPRSSVGQSRGGLAGGLGISAMGGRSFSSQSMGSFGLPRGTTSEDRYNRSLGPRIGGNMMRTSSQGGSFGMLPPMSHSTSRQGHSRSSNRGTRRMPQDQRGAAALDPDVVPLAVTANAWVNARSAGTDEKSPAYIERKVKALLNKLTEEKFDSISVQILEWANKSREETDGMTLKLVIKLVFEKSTDEAHWSAMYAKLCRLLLDRLDPAVTEVIDGKSVSGGSLFRKYLLGRCQADFEAGWKAREEAAMAATAKSAEDKEKMEQSKDGGDEGDAPMMSDEYYAAQKAKRRGLGLVQLIGELYKLEMLSKGVIRECLIRLLGNVANPDEEDLESTCKLLTTVGRQFEESSPKPMDVVMERLAALTRNDNVSARIRFMIMDVIDLRKNKWHSRKEAVPTTIAQIHQQAARENAEKAQAARESISRGGSRAGHSRRENSAQPGEWQSVNTGSRPPQRPTDFSNIGRGVSSAALPSNPTFGPSGVFARGKKGNATGNTPPLSRHSSTTNMFGVLNEAADGGSSDAADAPQRKKLQLAPRTKPLPGQDDDGENQSDAGSMDSDADGEGDAAQSMTEEEAQKKIANDLKELWGEKDAGGSRNPDDISEYFGALPVEFRPLLSEKLAEDVFRIAKYRDAEVVAKGWKAALKASTATVEDLKKGLESRMVTLDDDAIDFPQAYKAIAVLIRSLDLGSDDVDALVAMIDVYGEPRVTPKMKLDKALGQVDEEASV